MLSRKLPKVSFALPFTTTLAGPASVDRNIEVDELDVGYAMTERVRLVGDLRRSTLEQGSDATSGAGVGAGAWDLATTGVEAGAEVAVNGAIRVAAGWSRGRAASR